MKYLRIPLLAAVLLLSAAAAGLHAQITNLTFDHQGTTFTMTTGDTISWEYNCPAGATVSGEIWYDADRNGVIDTTVDINFATFALADGDTNGNGGPPDMDGTVNGHVIFAQTVGIVPGKYIMRFSNNGSSVFGYGTVAPLASPAHIISGHVTPPAGKSARWITVELKPGSNDKNGGDKRIFWDAFADSLGNYSIAMNADTAGNPWSLRVNNNRYPTALVDPQEAFLSIIDGNYSGYNFSMTMAAATVSGHLRDNNGNPISNAEVFVQPMQTQSQFMGPQFGAQTDNDGFFQIGIPASALNGTTWRIQESSNDRGMMTHMLAMGMLGVIANGDSIRHDLIAYQTNTVIRGRVLVNGHNANFSVQLIANYMDMMQSFVWSDSATGYFTIPVCTAFGPYTLMAVNLPFPYSTPNVIASGGDSGKVINITTVTGVGPVKGTGVPAQYALGQNYPNPFNPATTIRFDLPKNGFTTLDVYNILGQRVKSALAQTLPAGEYTVNVDMNSFSTGVYFYRLQSGEFHQVRKLMLSK